MRIIELPAAEAARLPVPAGNVFYLHPRTHNARLFQPQVLSVNCPVGYVFIAPTQPPPPGILIDGDLVTQVRLT